MKNKDLRKRLLRMASEDREVRQTLVVDGALWDGGYHPRMEDVHRRNGARLSAIIARHGWPGRSQVGDDGAEAAWIILQHAIGNPSLQRRGLEILKEAAAKGEVPACQVAALEDRVRVLEGRSQLYGTQLDWDDNGELSPLPIEDPSKVDLRRRSVGLGPLEEHVAERRQRAKAEGELPPANLTEYRRRMDRWARSVGWRD